jgi:hypothetical protein
MVSNFFIILNLQMHFIVIQNDRLQDIVSLNVIKLMCKIVYLSAVPLYDKREFKIVLFNSFP